jgi:hypothetical protein
MSSNTWHGSRTVWPENAHTIEEDWTLIDGDGEKLARIYDVGRDDGVNEGNWRWRIYRRDGIEIGGSANDGMTAKHECERRVDKLRI